ncbi:MAG: phosphoribosylamine--glycine ligase [Elusimicrobia bacterium]|nr:phosphoribosylamine--glycine ligase [Elusimicrobiota bacterium]
MKFFIIGSGAREHALGWKLKTESPTSELFFAPGNGGTSLLGENVPILCHSRESGNPEPFSSLAKKVKADLVVIGPEAPLADGAADQLRQSGFKVFGPNRAAARLEASKVFAKDFCRKWKIPTADFRVFDNFAAALAYVHKAPYPLVVKADGLAQGKGVVIAQSAKEAESTLRSFMEKATLGEAGRRLVMEEFLTGEELSVLAFFDGKEFVLLPPARDYKKLKDGNKGPNTGGMGAVAPVAISQNLWTQITATILERFRDGLEREGIGYSGLIYFGLMLTKKGPKVLEFNVRFGDPETQVLVPLTDLPFHEIMQATEEGFLSKFKRTLFLDELDKNPRAAVCVVLASEGYPEKPKTGRPLTLPSPPGRGLSLFVPSPLGRGQGEGNSGGDVMVFHAGTVQDNGRLVTSSGRVLSVVGKGATLKEASRASYALVRAIRFEGMQLRRDIGF